MKAVVVLCEGRHEILFVQRSMGAIADCRWVNASIVNLPSPFGTMPGRSKGLIATRLERDVDELTLRGAAYPPLPQFESALIDKETDALFILVRANGKNQAGAIIDLLDEVHDSMDVDDLDVSTHAVAFLFDANAAGLAATLDQFRRDYESHFGGLADVAHSGWIRTAKCPLGVFVIHRSDTDSTGTLEDHLAPMVESAWPDWYAGARGFIDGHRRGGDGASRNEAARLKAIITSAGQLEHPGTSLATVVDRDGLPEAQYKASPLAQTLTAFLRTVPWNISAPVKTT